ncbi:hypothetical protein G7072_16480 [Nocardioides sp. HDW12B]|uniref:flagellar biosynthetic protein FliQ n=1 Tax=Nocardioides sp. HDW12B TaxID=2714939 RepID=UPI00140E204B|nr:flagellar biosynthetic protein FliQ [Nocardioides sp. HDW12B]QIK67729.1 hypothetical protein G7072_16480 [Nocardioides sp. HDW12B]
MAKYEDERPGRTLLTAVAAMLGVALVVGLVIGGVAMVALKDVLGGSTEAAEQESEQSLFIPKYRATKGADDDPKIPGVQTPSSTEPLEQTKEPTKAKVTLFVAPQQVSPGERINFNGVYVDGEGASLQIQRREGGTWTDFPVTASVRGGSFETWIQTSRTGEQVFRVFDVAEERGSNTVTVTVG